MQGIQGPPGTVDTSNLYNKLRVDFAILSSKPSARLSDGAQTYDSNTNVIRPILGTGGIQTHIFMNHTNPEDNRNGSLVVNGDGVGGGSSIDPNVATFEDNTTTTTISFKKPVTAFVGLDVMSGIVTDVLEAQQVTTQSFNNNGLQISGNGNVAGALTTRSMACTGDVAADNISVGVC